MISTGISSLGKVMDVVTYIVLYSQRSLPGGFQLIDISVNNLLPLEARYDKLFPLGNRSDFP